MDHNITPIPPAPETLRMRVEGDALILDFGDGRRHTVATVHNDLVARRLAACWVACIGQPTSALEAVAAAVAIDPATLTRDERSILLYAETRVVDAGGLLVGARMNADDIAALKKFQDLGILECGRIPWRVIGGLVHEGPNLEYTHWVTFKEGAWRLVNALRRMRAEADRGRSNNRKMVDAALADRAEVPA